MPHWECTRGTYGNSQGLVNKHLTKSPLSTYSPWYVGRTVIYFWCILRPKPAENKKSSLQLLGQYS